MCDYERYVEAQRKENALFLESLNLKQPESDLGPTARLYSAIDGNNDPEKENPTKRSKRTKLPIPKVPLLRRTSSRRNAGDAEDAEPENKVEVQVHDDPERIASGGRKRGAIIPTSVRLPNAEDVTVPFMLIKERITVTNMGRLYIGPNKKAYMSQKGCLYKHPYPIGYTAQKVFNGRLMTMTIREGSDGPLFRVAYQTVPRSTANSDGEGEKLGEVCFEGTSPTYPWTEVCRRGPMPKRRVSGPLFFGFSDPLTQHLIQHMEGYDGYEGV